MTYTCDFCSEKTAKDECLGNGKYCPYQPSVGIIDKAMNFLDTKGKDLLTESLRQKCVSEVLTKSFKDYP